MNKLLNSLSDDNLQRVTKLVKTDGKIDGCKFLVKELGYTLRQAKDIVDHIAGLKHL